MSTDEPDEHHRPERALGPVPGGADAVPTLPDADVRTRLAIEASGLGTWSWNADTGDVVWDEALERIYGLDPGGFPRTYDEYIQRIHPEDRAAVAASVQASLEGAGDHRVEHRVIWPGGAARWVEGWGRVLKDADGRPTGLVGVTADITRRKKQEERLRRLQAVTAALAEARTTEEVGRVALHELVVATEAVGSSLLLLEEDGVHITLAATSLPDADIPPEWRRFDTGSSLSGAQAIRSGRIVIRAARDAEGPTAVVARAVGPFSPDSTVMSLPLRAGSRILGAIGLAMPAEPDRTSEWEEFMLTLGGQFGQALERAQLYAAEREAISRLRLLADASRLLGASLEYQQTVRQLAAAAVPAFADWCTVELLDEHGHLQLLAAAHAEPEKEQLAWDLRAKYPPDPDAPTGGPNVVRTGQSELLTTIPKELLEAVTRERPELAHLIEQLNLTSAMTVPLLARGRAIGAMSFVWGESARHYNEADLEVAEELARRAAVAIDNARLFDEQRRVADTLQSSLRPPSLPEVPGVELAAEYRPGGPLLEVAGDFYDVFELRPGSWFAVVGDVCGKGVDAAAVMALARYTIRTAALRQVRPSSILSTLNEALLRSGFDRFVTVAALRIDEGERSCRITLSSGGHPGPLLLAREAATIVEVPGPLLGVLEEPQFNDEVFELESGDMIVLYTDGVTEAHRGSELFGEDRLLAAGRASAHEAADKLVRKVLEAVEAFSGGPSGDDIAVLAVRRR